MRASTELTQQLCTILKSAKNSALPCYKQLYEALRQQILDGLLLPGMALPSSRILAKQLGIARNTVTAAIEQLCMEGYAITQPKSGIYIATTTPVTWNSSYIAPTTKLDVSARGKKIAQQAQMPQLRGAFALGVPDLTLFPFHLWQRYVARQARNPLLHWQINSREGGHPELRQALRDYLRIARGIRCNTEQILITHGTQHSLQLIADLLADPGDKVVMENPGYLGAQCAFAAAGLNILYQSVDAEGISIEEAVWQQQPRLIYTTPSHQYPMGVVMTAARRRQLLARATQQQCWVIEDDYDSEFRYAGNPIAALQALAPEQVIYLGTFSKTFFPAMHIGYMVLPQHLVEHFRVTQTRHLREPSYITQKALADFIHDGHASAHIRKMRREYHERRDKLVDVLQNKLGDLVRLDGLDTGIHLVAYLPKKINDSLITATASQQGIIARAISEYCYEKNAFKMPGLVLGFGDANSQTILCAGEILCQIILNSFESIS